MPRVNRVYFSYGDRVFRTVKAFRKASAADCSRHAQQPHEPEQAFPNPVPLSVPEIASHRHGLPRRCRERFCRIPYRWLSKIRLPAAQARMKACPHAGMQRCRQTDCAMRAKAPLPSFCQRPDASGEGDPSRKPGPVLRTVPLWSARCRAMFRDPGNLACNEVTLPGQPNHPFMIIPLADIAAGGSLPGSGVEPSKMIPVPQQP